MTIEDRRLIIENRMQSLFSPAYLEVIDESNHHIGHAGYQGGGRHFAIIIASEQLHALTKINAHRQIYAALSDLLPEKIHALRIQILSGKNHNDESN